MSLIIIKSKEVLDIYSLFWTALRYIFEPEKLSANQIRMMEQSVVNWSQKIELDRDRQRVNEQEEYLLQIIGTLLKGNMEGKFESRKKLYREHHLDWRKVYGMPGAHTQESFAKGKQIYEKWAKENPELAN